MKTRYVYVAGPMRGYDAYNFPQFFEVEDAVFRASLVFTPNVAVFNPARNDIEKNGLKHLTPQEAGEYLLDNPGEFDLRAALRDDLAWIAEVATDIVLLPGWEKSKGAQAEVALGRALGLGLRIWQACWNNIRLSWEFDLLLERDLPVADPLLVPSPEPLAFKPPDQAIMDAIRAGEVRTVSATGGEKGVKPEQYQSIPPRAEQELAEHYAKGAAKYGDHNFRKGYEWSKSYSALRRHLRAFWAGEDIDAETGSKHIIAVAWHALTLATFMDEHREYDDRYRQPVDPDAWDGDEEEGGAPFTLLAPGPTILEA